jgi:hypothetical protein
MAVTMSLATHRTGFQSAGVEHGRLCAKPFGAVPRGGRKPNQSCADPLSGIFLMCEPVKTP